jgi:hypothetical protein
MEAVALTRRIRSVFAAASSAAENGWECALALAPVEGDGAVESLEAVAVEVAAAARAAEADPGFPREAVERIRAATAWLGVTESADDDLRHAALVLSRQAGVDLAPPTVSSTRARRLVKRLVSRVLGWYFRFLADQLAALGQGMARLGLAAARRVERIEADQAATRAELESLRARLARLEAAAGSEPEAEPANRP